MHWLRCIWSAPRPSEAATFKHQESQFNKLTNSSPGPRTEVLFWKSSVSILENYYTDINKWPKSANFCLLNTTLSIT